MLPAFATLEDLDARIPGGIKTADEARAQADLLDASTLIREEADKTWVDENEDLVEDLPDIIVTVCIRVVRRAFENPEGLTQHSESIQGYSESRSFSKSSTDSELYLTATERRLVRKAAGKRPLWAQSTTRGDLETPNVDACADGNTKKPLPAGIPRALPAGTGYVDVEGQKPIPYVDPGRF